MLSRCSTQSVATNKAELVQKRFAAFLARGVEGSLPRGIHNSRLLLDHNSPLFDEPRCAPDADLDDLPFEHFSSLRRCTHLPMPLTLLHGFIGPPER